MNAAVLVARRQRVSVREIIRNKIHTGGGP